jgi:competence protein ComK
METFSVGNKGCGMYISQRYIIRDKLYFMIGYRKANGDYMTRIVEEKRDLIVDRHPESLIEETLNYFGFDLRGAVKSAGTILGELKMSPFIVNPNNTVCLLPAKSPIRGSLVYMNIQHIENIEPHSKGTIVMCSGNRSIILPSRTTRLVTKISQARTFRRTIIERNSGIERKIIYRYCRDTGRFIIHNDGDPD